MPSSGTPNYPLQPARWQVRFWGVTEHRCHRAVDRRGALIGVSFSRGHDLQIHTVEGVVVANV